MIPVKRSLQANVKELRSMFQDLFFTAAKQVDSSELKNRLALAEP
jgi:hypothetical protein